MRNVQMNIHETTMELLKCPENLVKYAQAIGHARAGDYVPKIPIFVGFYTTTLRADTIFYCKVWSIKTKNRHRIKIRTGNDWRGFVAGSLRQV